MFVRCILQYASWCLFFFFQAEDGIRDLVRSRGLGDVYKRQVQHMLHRLKYRGDPGVGLELGRRMAEDVMKLSLIHI